MTRRTLRGVVVLAALTLVVAPLAACDDDSGSSAQDLTVFSAASLTDAMADLASAFEDDHPGTTVTVNDGPSSGLREQILAGAPADVFASANASNMEQLVEAGAAAEPGGLRPQLARDRRPRRQPGRDHRPGRLRRPRQADRPVCRGGAVRHVRPAGAGRRRGRGLARHQRSPTCRALLTQIASGDLDAGIVYRTDVLAAGWRRRGHHDPRRVERRGRLPDRPARRQRRPRPRRRFRRLRRGPPAGQAILASYGFRRRERHPTRPPGGPCPWGVVPLAAVAIAFVLVPFVASGAAGALVATCAHLLGRPVVTDALRLSVVAALAATALALVFGVPLAWLLARVEFPGRSVLRALVLLPMVLPPVVGGAALLFALRPAGPVRRPAVRRAPASCCRSRIWGVIVANTFVAMPFLVITVEAGAAQRRPTLRGGRRHARRRPVDGVPPGHAAVGGPVARWPARSLCWARALGEFGATITFAGNLQGRTQTMPLAVYLALESDRDAAIALSLRAGRSCPWPCWSRSATGGSPPPAEAERCCTPTSRLALGDPRSGVCARRRRRRRGGAARAQRRRQDHRAAGHRRPRADRRRAHRAGRPVLDDPAAGVLRAAPRARDRRGLPGPPALPSPRRRSTTWPSGCGPGGSAGDEARAPGRPAGSNGSDWPTGPAPVPGELSGGQAQRVALARALVIEPRARCCSTNRSRRSTPGTRSRGPQRPPPPPGRDFAGPRLLVTHDPVDAVVLATRLVIIEDGPGHPDRHHGRGHRPAPTRYVADLVGINLLVGTTPATAGCDSSPATSSPWPAHCPVQTSPSPSGRSRSRCRAHEATGSPRNRWKATVAEIHPTAIGCGSPWPGRSEPRPRSPRRRSPSWPRARDATWASVKAVDLDVYPR